MNSASRRFKLSNFDPGGSNLLVAPSSVENATFWGDAQRRWRLTVHTPEGPKEFPPETDWEAVSPKFGAVRSAVVLNPDGTPAFDRPVYREEANVNCIAWGVDDLGRVRVGIVRQGRQHSSHPGQVGSTHDPVVFANVPMGFLKGVSGTGTHLENIKIGAVREVLEEVGGGAVLSLARPNMGRHNATPTYSEEWSDLVFVEVDLDQVTAPTDKDELIYSAEYILLSQLRNNIFDGVDHTGALYRAGNSNSTILEFIAWLSHMNHALAFQFLGDVPYRVPVAPGDDIEVPGIDGPLKVKKLGAAAIDQKWDRALVPVQFVDHTYGLVWCVGENPVSCHDMNGAIRRSVRMPWITQGPIWFYVASRDNEGEFALRLPTGPDGDSGMSLDRLSSEI